MNSNDIIHMAREAGIDAMQADPDYAWSWHCNVAMAFVDAGGDPYTANQGAARFMRLLANVDPAHELPPQQAEAVPSDVVRDAERFSYIAANLYHDGYAWWTTDLCIYEVPEKTPPPIDAVRSAIDAFMKQGGGV